MQLTTKRVAMFAKRPGRYHDGHGLILVVVNANNAIGNCAISATDANAGSA